MEQTIDHLCNCPKTTFTDNRSFMQLSGKKRLQTRDHEWVLWKQSASYITFSTEKKTFSFLDRRNYATLLWLFPTTPFCKGFLFWWGFEKMKEMQRQKVVEGLFCDIWWQQKTHYHLFRLQFPSFPSRRLWCKLGMGAEVEHALQVPTRKTI